jgi:hypothetical protein
MEDGKWEEDRRQKTGNDQYSQPEADVSSAQIFISQLSIIK